MNCQMPSAFDLPGGRVKLSLARSMTRPNKFERATPLCFVAHGLDAVEKRIVTLRLNVIAGICDGSQSPDSIGESRPCTTKSSIALSAMHGTGKMPVLRRFGDNADQKSQTFDGSSNPSRI